MLQSYFILISSDVNIMRKLLLHSYMSSESIREYSIILSDKAHETRLCEGEVKSRQTHGRQHTERMNLFEVDCLIE